MDKTEKLERYYQKEHPFKAGISRLRDLANQLDCQEDYKWNFPVYTVDGKNVFGICRFKNHFGIWFFNGVFLEDSKNVLENAQEGKTKGMRHWKFQSNDGIDTQAVIDYMKRSVENQKAGKVIEIDKNKKIVVPELLLEHLEHNEELKASFNSFSPYKQKEFCDYIFEAKQENTKLRRLEKILPMVRKGIGLNDAYR